MRGEEDTRKKTLRVHPVADTNRRKRHVGFLVLDPQPNSSAWSFWVFNQWVYFHLFSHQRTGGTSNRTDDQEHTHIYIYRKEKLTKHILVFLAGFCISFPHNGVFFFHPNRCAYLRVKGS